MGATPILSTPETQWLAKILRMQRLSTKYIASAIADSGVAIVSDFTIGDGNPGTPVNGTDEYANPAMDGLTVKIFKNGTGYLTEDVDYDLIAGGGFELLGGGIFSTDERYLVFRV